MPNQPNHLTKSAGKKMWLFFCASGFGLLVFFFSHQESQWNNPNANPEGTETTVILKSNIHGHYVTTGYINEHKVEFLLDTGATDVVIPEKIANKIGLTKGRQSSALTANGTIVVYKTYIDSLRIGELVLQNIDASINPAMEGTILLGMSALKKVSFEQYDNTLTLTKR